MEYITSDLHFFHKNILKFSPKRECFKDINHMNEVLIQEWNSKVTEQDTIYHLGDFSFAGREKTRSILERLNGNKIFLLGNHCYKLKGLYEEYGEVYDYLEIKHKDVKVCLMHYPITAWNEQGRGSVMLHGHCHGSYQGEGRILDVGWCKHGRILTLDSAVQWCINRDIVVVDRHKIV